MINFEILDRDANGRITKISHNGKSITLPDIAIVFNPVKLLIKPADAAREFKMKLMITNSYIIKKHKDVLEKISAAGGLHSFFSFKDFIMTDSGAYQAMFGGTVHATNEEIVNLQKVLKPDIAVFLDVPTAELSGSAAVQTVEQTIARAKETKEIVSRDAELQKILWAGPLQGGSNLKLLEKSAKTMAALDFDVYPVGSIVPRLMKYDFLTVAEMLLNVRKNVPTSKPIHAFGLGLPQAMSFFVALGADIFDCAGYALFAYDDRYMSLEGTHRLSDLYTFPCNCPLCSRAEPKDVLEMPKAERELWLARHNLYVTFQEIKTIRTAIKENWLWELVQQRARTHPNLLIALRGVLKKYSKYLMQFEPITKKSALQWSGEESLLRPEIMRAKEMLKRFKGRTKKIQRAPYGKIPSALLYRYPFGQCIFPENKEERVSGDPKKIVSDLIDFQFSNGAAKLLGGFHVEISKTSRIRKIYTNDGKFLGTIRPSDGVFVPSMLAAEKMFKRMKKVRASEDAIEFILEGKSLFSKFAEPLNVIYPLEEVAVVDGKGRLIAIGIALLNSKEMKEFKRGVAVCVREARKPEETHDL